MKTRTAFTLVELLVVIAIITVLLAVGCGGPESSSVRLEGTVTVDSSPVQRGVITFVPQLADQGTVISATIVAGQYRANVLPGPLRVHIQATEKTGRTVDVFGVREPEWENIIPNRYRDGVEIEVSKDVRKDFLLSTK